MKKRGVRQYRGVFPSANYAMCLWNNTHSWLIPLLIENTSRLNEPCLLFKTRFAFFLIFMNFHNCFFSITLVFVTRISKKIYCTFKEALWQNFFSLSTKMESVLILKAIFTKILHSFVLSHNYFYENVLSRIPYWI